MSIGLNHPITEICFLVRDIERSIEFYERLGFTKERRGDGFVSFNAAGMQIALWESDYVSRHVGFAAPELDKPVHKVMTALRVASFEIVDSIYEELKSAGISTLSSPRVYEEWNAYCVYFADPDGNTWEVYAWGEGGADRIKNSTWM